MNGIDVYKEVAQSRDTLKEVLKSLQESKIQPINITNTLENYNFELNKLVTFLHKNTSNSLVFRKNVLNVIFKQSNLETVQTINRILSVILQHKTEILSILEQAKDIEALHMKDSLTLLNEKLNSSYNRLSSFRQNLQNILNKKEQIRDKKEEIPSKDLEGLHTVKSASDLSFTIPPKKPFFTTLPNFFGSKSRKAAKVLNDKDTTRDNKDETATIVVSETAKSPHKNNRL